MALSKDFFLCGWNIFDLIIVSASLVDIIFELVDGLSVLRGLRLLRVIKLARSWTTMKVLLKILEQTIGKFRIEILFKVSRNCPIARESSIFLLFFF